MLSVCGWSKNMDYEELHDLTKPVSLPDKGSDVGASVHENRDIFGNDLLCKAEFESQILGDL